MILKSTRNNKVREVNDSLARMRENDNISFIDHIAQLILEKILITVNYI